MWQSILVISLGAAAGALARWGLGLGLNALFPLIPLGTLTANLLGGYLVGLAVAALASALALRSSSSAWLNSARSFSSVVLGRSGFMGGPFFEHLLQLRQGAPRGGLPVAFEDVPQQRVLFVA